MSKRKRTNNDVGVDVRKDMGFELELWCLTPLSQYFSYIVAVSFIGGGNRNTWSKLPTCCKSLTNFIT